MIQTKELRSTVFLERFSTFESQNFIESVKNFGLFPKLVQASNIVIKPNLCAGTIFKSPSPVVTNAQVLEFIIRAIISVNSKATFFIAESDSIGPGLAHDKFRNQEYAEQFDRYPQVNLLDLSRSQVASYPCASLFFKHGIVLPTMVVEADFLVSLGKIKTHTNTVVSGILKNQFGCLPETNKSQYHPYLSNVLADINSVIQPDLCILEGCPAMEGSGPIDGSPLDLDLLILGKDAVAVDATMARVMGLVPERIKILKRAHEAGQGLLRTTDIEIIGLSLTEVQRPFRFISQEQRFYIGLGFVIQRIGDRINKLGHLIHSVQGTFWAIGKLIRKLTKKRL